MRLLFAPYGTAGDVHPLVALALAARRAGHQVMLAAPGNFADLARRFDLPFVAATGDLQARLARAGPRLLHRRWQQTEMTERAIPELFASLPEAAQGMDGIIGAGVQLAGPSIAEALDIPYIFVGYTPVSWPSRCHPPPTARSFGLPTPLNRLQWWLLGQFAQRGLGPAINLERRRLGLPPWEATLDRLAGLPAILSADPVLAPPPPDLRHVRLIHPLRLVENRPLDGALGTFLEAGPAPIYLGMGSMPLPNLARFEAALSTAIAQLTGAGHRLVVSAGWAGLAKALPASEGVFLAAGHLPHDGLFPRCAGIIHHGGAGTTLTAARAGRAQAILPILLDQYYWRHRIRRLGVGPAGPSATGIRGPGPFQHLVTQLSSPAYAARAAELGQGIRARERAQARQWQDAQGVTWPLSDGVTALEALLARPDAPNRSGTGRR